VKYSLSGTTTKKVIEEKKIISTSKEITISISKKPLL
jgi:hypothetical protein